MNRKFYLSVFFIFAVSSLFFSCTNLEEKENGTESENQDFVIHLYDENLKSSSSEARIIRPFTTTELSWVSAWNISFTDLSDSSNSFTLSTADSASGTESYAVLSDSTVTLKRIPESTYKIELEGSFTEDSYTASFYGTLASVAVGSGVSSVSIPVGLKKSESGSLALTFTDSESALSNSYSKIKLNLKSTTGTESYDFEVSASPDDSTEFIYSSNAGSFTLTKSGIPSGYYRITFSYESDSEESGFKVFIPEQYRTVEVVDGVKTEKSDGIPLSVSYEKNYYATNSSSAAKKNGLAVSSKKYLKSLLALIAEKLENSSLEESSVNIYMGEEIPEIDADTYSTLVDAIKAGNKSLLLGIYGAGQTEKSSLTIMNAPSDSDDTSQSLSSDINYSIVLTSGETSSTFNVNTLTATQGSPFSLTFKNGANLAASEGETSLLNAEIKINAIKENSDGSSEANYTAYLLTDTSSDSGVSPLFECKWTGSDTSTVKTTPCTVSFVLNDSEDCGYELVDKTDTATGTCKTYFEVVSAAESD